MWDEKMKTMCQSMMSGMFDTETQKGPDYATPEIRGLFEDWVNQVREEIERYKKENPAATNAELARYLKISEESLAYFNGGGEKKAGPDSKL